VLIIGLPLAQMVRGTPEAHGLLPDGDQPALPHDPSLNNLGGLDENEFTVGEALRDRSFWYISVGHGIALIAVFAVMVHLVPHLVQGLGWSETSAQAMFTLVTVTSIVGQVGGGFLGDRYNKARIAGLCMFGHAGALLLFVIATSVPMVAVAAAIHGLSWGTRGPLMMAIRADYYGRKNFGTIVGYSNILVMVGPLIGPTFAGAMSDRYNDYGVAFLSLAILVGASSLFFFLARTPPTPNRLVHPTRIVR
jgi:MFS family permease